MKRIYTLFIIFIISVTVVLWIDFEIFPLINSNLKECSKINDLLLIVALSYITSFLFYFIVVFLKEQKDKLNSKAYIKNKTEEIINNADSLRIKIERIDQTRFDDYIPNKDLLRIKLSKIKLTDDAGEKRLYPFTWEQFFKEHTEKARNNIDRLLILLPYLDSLFVSRLNKLYECMLLKMVTELAPMKLIEQKLKEINATNFSIVYVDLLYEYFEIIKEIKIAHNK